MRLRFVLSICVTLFTGIFAAGCGTDSGSTGSAHSKGSPYASGNYPGTLKIGNPYDIAGRTYYPSHQPDYVEEGMASWYGPGFHGKSTANGERFDQYAMTAAHRTLPMPSVVRVRNLENGREVVLKVNDRGPFAKDRIIDLSKKAAEELGVIANGTARVRVEYLQEESRQLVANLLRNNQIRADEATLAMLAMDDLKHVKQGRDMSPSGFTMISSANAADTVNPSVQRGVVDRAPLSPVESRALPPVVAPNEEVIAQREVQIARIERPAPEPAPMTPYDAGGVVPRVMPEQHAPLEVPPVGAIPEYAPPPATIEQPLMRPDDAPQELQPLPPEETPAPVAPAVPEVTPAPPAASYGSEHVTATTIGNHGIFIQAGAFSQEQNAHALTQRLSGFGRSLVKPVEVGGRRLYRVQVGPLASLAEANSALRDIHSMGLHDAHLVK